jgi:hypothetical protein
MTVTQLSHCGNGIKSRIFRQSQGDDLKSISISFEAVRINTSDRLGMFGQAEGTLSFWCSSTSNQGPEVNTVKQISRHLASIFYLCLTRHLMTQSASCRDRSASASTSLLLPWTKTVTVLPAFRIPVIFTTLLVPPVDTSSTRSALARFSGVKWSKLAMGRQLRVYNHYEYFNNFHYMITLLMFRLFIYSVFKTYL